MTFKPIVKSKILITNLKVVLRGERKSIIHSKKHILSENKVVIQRHCQRIESLDLSYFNYEVLLFKSK